MRTPMRVVFVLLLAAFLLPLLPASPARAQAAPWEAIGPFGGVVTALEVAPGDPRILYAGTRGAGVFRSGDGGRSWAPRRDGLPDLAVAAVAVDPRDPGVVYAGTESRGVFKSRDGGVTWSPANRGLESFSTVRVLLVDPAEPRRLYLLANAANAANTELFRSLDRGASWLPAGSRSSGLTALALAPSSPRTLYAASSSAGFLRSTDFGATWTPAGAGPPVSPGGSVVSLAVDPRAPRTVYAGLLDRAAAPLFKSTDGGATWHPARQGLPTGAAVLVLRSDASRTLYAGTDQGVFKSTDGGRRWQAARTGLEEGLTVRALAIHPSVPSVLWAGAGNLGVYRSRDAGASWQPSRRGLSAVVVDAMAFERGAPDLLYAATSQPGIVWRSRDGGRRWAPLRRGLRAELIRSVAVSPLVPGLVFAGTSEGVFRSTDSGALWVRRSRGLAPAFGGPFWAFALEFHPTDPDVVYAGGWDEIYTSRDRGETWQLTGKARNVQVESIATTPADPDVVYAGGTAIFGEEDPLPYLFRSDDAGATWIPLDFNGNVQVAADPFDADTLLVGSALGLFRSVDRGRTFEKADLPSVGPRVDRWAVAFAPSSPGTAYAAGNESGGDAVLLRTRDSGATWERLDLDAILRRVEIRSLAVDEEGNVYLATTGAGIFRLRVDG